MEFSKDILENYGKYNQDEERIMKKMTAVGKKMDKLSESELEKITLFKKMLDVILK